MMMIRATAISILVNCYLLSVICYLVFQQVAADHEDGAVGVIGDEVGNGAEEEAAHAPIMGGADDDQVGIAVIEEGHEAVGKALVGHVMSVSLFMMADVRPC